MDVLEVSEFLAATSGLLRQRKTSGELLFHAIVDDCYVNEVCSTSPEVERAAKRLHAFLSDPESRPALEPWQSARLTKFTKLCRERGVTASFLVPDHAPVLFAPQEEREWLPYEAPVEVSAFYRGYEVRDGRVRLHVTINDEQMDCSFEGPVAQLEELGAPASPFVIRCKCTVRRSRVTLRPISYVIESVKRLRPFAEVRAELLEFFRELAPSTESSAG